MKFIVFLPIILFFGFFGLLILGFIFLVFKLVMNAKNSSWIGVVIDKKFNQKREDHKVENFFVLVVHPDVGRDMNLGVSQQLYDSFNIGDRIKKDKGELWPKKA